VTSTGGKLFNRPIGKSVPNLSLHWTSRNLIRIIFKIPIEICPFKLEMFFLALDVSQSTTSVNVALPHLPER
jgi:hypothetical protein